MSGKDSVNVCCSILVIAILKDGILKDGIYN